jgi:hypothetical protein
VVDLDGLRATIEQAVDRFTEDMTRVWEEACASYFVDLRRDPRPISAPFRPANTNGSILLDRYACLATPEAIRLLGWEMVLTWILVGVVTEGDPLFRCS